MSIAVKSTQVVFTQKGSVYMPFIQSDKGDLYQEYTGSSSAPDAVAPDFSTLTPVLSFIISSSRTADGLVTPNNVDWYFNDTLITFGSDGVSTNTFGGETGHFSQITAGSGQTYYGLKILKNLVKAAGGAAITIKGIATVSVGNGSEDVSAVYNIPVTKSVGSQYHVTIMAGDNKYFTLTDKGDSCKLTAVARMSMQTDELTSGLTYKWFKLVNGAWSDLSLTSKTIEVSDEMVDTTGVFKVEVSQNGTFIGMDTQTVTDASDPFDILPMPVPESEVIQNEGDTVVYTPRLVKRGSSDAYDTSMTFYFALTDPAGNLLNTDSTTAFSSYTVPYATAAQAGTVNVTITTAQ